MQEVLAAVLSAFFDTIRSHGLDVTAPLALSWYNDAVPENIRLSLNIVNGASGETENSSTAPIDCLVVLVGNSKTIWEKFVAAYSGNTNELQSERHPLNCYVADALKEGLLAAGCCPIEDAPVQSSVLMRTHAQDASHCEDASSCEASRGSMLPGSDAAEGSRGSGIPAHIYWSHDTRPGRLVAVQRMAHAAGLAFLDEVSHLCIHPTFGPWIALRAAIVFPTLPPPAIRPPALQCPISEATRAQVTEAIDSALRSYNEAVAASSDKSSEHGLGNWRLWVASRDAVWPRHAWRYSEEQIEYHYTTDANVLHNYVKGLK